MFFAKNKTAFLKVLVDVVVVVIIITNIISLSAYAFKPSPGLHISVNLKSLNQKVAYVDLLLPLKEGEIPLIAENEKSVFSDFSGETIKLVSSNEIAQKQIINEKEYYSFLFYYPSSNITLYNNGEYFAINEEEYNLVNKLKKYESLVFAFVDNDGKIIALSNEFKIKSTAYKVLENIRVDGKDIYLERTTNYYVLLYAKIIIVFVLLIIFVLRRIIKKRYHKCKPFSAQ